MKRAENGRGFVSVGTMGWLFSSRSGMWWTGRRPVAGPDGVLVGGLRPAAAGRGASDGGDGPGRAIAPMAPTESPGTRVVRRGSCLELLRPEIDDPPGLDGLVDLEDGDGALVGQLGRAVERRPVRGRRRRNSRGAAGGPAWPARPAAASGRPRPSPGRRRRRSWSSIFWMGAASDRRRPSLTSESHSGAWASRMAQLPRWGTSEGRASRSSPMKIS